MLPILKDWLDLNIRDIRWLKFKRSKAVSSEKILNRDFSNEINYTASQSGGPGGQNVNKVNTKITLRFDIGKSTLLNEDEKQRLRDKLSNKISNEDILIITSESKRSQLKNKEEATKKFYSSLNKALAKKKKRKATKPTRAAKQKRLKEKRVQAEKKQLRQKIE